MAVLRISEWPASGGVRRVEVTWQDGASRRVAVSSFGYQVESSEAETIRWYLEDFAEFPDDPGSAIARQAEIRLAQIGVDLFRRVFADREAADVWQRAQAQLGQVRVEVDVDPAETPGLPWELLRDPATDTAVALAAGEFVRTHLRSAGHPSLPAPAGDTMRVLLAICRPGGREDVPFRSVASRLVRGGADQMEGLDLDVLRPASFERLARVLHEAAAADRPYHVVHFDGHGTYLDLTELDQSALNLSPARFAVSVAGPVRPGRHGYLLFEDPDRDENRQLVDGPAMGQLLVDTRVPVLILNGCRSAYAEAPDRPMLTDIDSTSGDGDKGFRELGDVHARIRAYGSLAAEVADAGVPGVVAMAYNVYVVTVAQYVADLYAHLLAGRSLGQAATAARRALAADPVRQITTTSVELQDWVVPVVYEAAPLILLRPDRPGGAADPARSLRRGRRRGDGRGAATAGCRVLRPGRHAAGAGPDVRHQPGGAAGGLRRSREVSHRGGVRRLVLRHGRAGPAGPGAGGGAVVVVRALPAAGHTPGRWPGTGSPPSWRRPGSIGR